MMARNQQLGMNQSHRNRRNASARHRCAAPSPTGSSSAATAATAASPATTATAHRARRNIKNSGDDITRAINTVDKHLKKSDYCDREIGRAHV